MTLNHALRLPAMLTDTVTAQQHQDIIEDLQQRLAAVEA